METFYLCLSAFLAGLVDSIVGGGGLIQLPALFLFLPGSLANSVPAVFGTNKLSSMCGTAVAVVQYSRRVQVNWGSLMPAGITAFALSFLGARTVLLVKPEFLKPMILILLVVVAVSTWWRNDFGNLHAPQFAAHHERSVGIMVGGAIGFYDGFFGPGTGSFLIFIFIGVFGFDFLHASASAKLINFATNLAAVLYFGATGNILYRYAIPMALCNVLGSMIGTRLAIWKGNLFIRLFFLAIVSAMIVRFGYELWRG